MRISNRQLTYVDRKLYNSFTDWLAQWDFQSYESPEIALKDILEQIKSWGTQWIADSYPTPR